MNNTELRKWLDEHSSYFSRYIGIIHENENLKFGLEDTNEPIIRVKYKDLERKCTVGGINAEEIEIAVRDTARDVFIVGKEKDFRLNAKKAGVNYSKSAWDRYVLEIIYSVQQIENTENIISPLLSYQGRPSLFIDEKDLNVQSLPGIGTQTEVEIQTEVAIRMRKKQSKDRNVLINIITTGTELDHFKKTYPELGESFSFDLERLIFRQYPQFTDRIMEETQGVYLPNADIAMIYKALLTTLPFRGTQEEKDTFEKQLYNIVTPLHAFLLEKYQQAFLTAKEQALDSMRTDPETIKYAEQFKGDKIHEKIYAHWWGCYLMIGFDKKESHRAPYETAIDAWSGREGFAAVYKEAQHDFENGLKGIDKKIYEDQRSTMKTKDIFSLFLQHRGFGLE